MRRRSSAARTLESEPKTMADRITQQEHSCLAVLEDWKAPFEVAAALYPKGASIPQRKKVAEALRNLHRDGLLQFGAPNNTYRRTEAGSAALGGGRVISNQTA
jgi:cystathionine beta-lyase/cystathionine gamma-synthase